MSAQRERVSVVIPTFNRAHLVTDALNSVVAQDYRPIEILVVDDSSTDDTETVVASWAKDHGDVELKYFVQVKAGGNAARNLGIREARGEYIAFLDSDDVWHLGKLTKQANVLDHHPDVGAVYCGLREVDIETGKVIGQSSHAYPQGDLLDQLVVKDVTAPTSTYLVRRSLILEAGCFDVSLEARQDWDMWIRLAERAKIGCVPEALVDLRHHSGPRTATDPNRELRAYARILEKYDALRKTRGIAVRLAARASFFRRTGRVHFHYMGERWVALRYYCMAILVWPFAPDSWAALIGWFLTASMRQSLRRYWNGIFGRTPFAIRSH